MRLKRHEHSEHGVCYLRSRGLASCWSCIPARQYWRWVANHHRMASRLDCTSVITCPVGPSMQVFAKLRGADYEEEPTEEEEVDEGPLWFTSLADFKPLSFKYLSGRYSSSYFACSVKTGEYYILKQYEKGTGGYPGQCKHVALCACKLVRPD